MIKTTELNKKDLEVIFDVLNVYDPTDIQHVYPEMGEQEFLDDVGLVWKKVLDMIGQTDNHTHSDMLETKKWE
tara:strand:+ start:39 stop:257 length:219 start_codon:yes stop_codon:yes gene_type:complete